MGREVEVTMRGIRCFVAEQTIKLRPLTLLVGENSSGKSTFLAVLATLFGESGFPFATNFNVPPFNLGTFDTIASQRSPKDRTSSQTFSMGYSLDNPPIGIPDISVTFGSESNRIEVREFVSIGRDTSVAASAAKNFTRVEITDRRSDSKTTELKFPGRIERDSPYAWIDHISKGSPEGHRSRGFVDLMEVFRLLPGYSGPFKGCFPMSPMRAGPSRTYDAFVDHWTTNGAHVPTLLAQVLNSPQVAPKGQRIVDIIETFGRASGLFKRISVRRLGKSAVDPFRIQVHSDGTVSNWIDVGYGVSQSLPLIVELAHAENGSLVLIQQPEVHLHPRAQAALGTLFSHEVSSQSATTIVVETHSDFLVDRVRYEISQGTLRPDDVSLLFFDKPKRETTVHAIEIDEMGNVIDPPESYREFFLDEQIRFLERGG